MKIKDAKVATSENITVIVIDPFSVLINIKDGDFIWLTGIDIIAAAIATLSVIAKELSEKIESIDRSIKEVKQELKNCTDVTRRKYLEESLKKWEKDRKVTSNTLERAIIAIDYLRTVYDYLER